MTHPPPEPDLAALREEIRRAGRITRSSRRELLVLAALLFLIQLCIPLYVHDRWHASFLLAMLFFSSLAILMVALPYAAWYRKLKRGELRDKLAHLPREEVAEVLLPLREDELGDTRKLVEPLLRELRIPTELIPAPSPEGSGREVAPREERQRQESP